MVPDLFVYGTLLPHATSALGRDMRARLAAGARLLGPATMHGRLYDLGEYPGLVLAGEPGDEVHGVVLRLADPAGTFPWLDAYEGIGPASPTRAASDDEYERVLAPARLAGGTLLSVWVYACRAPIPASRHIADGRWPSEI